MAELADAHGSGPCESNFMQVQVLLPAPKNPSLVTWIFLSIAKQRYIVTARSVVYIISPFGAVSHHGKRAFLLRNDDIHAFGVIEIRELNSCQKQQKYIFIAILNKNKTDTARCPFCFYLFNRPFTSSLFIFAR